MSTRRFSTTALSVVLALTFATAPAMANPGNGNGGGHGNGGGQGNSGNHGNGNAGNHGNKHNNGQDNPGKSDKSFKNSKDVGNDVDARVSFDHARHLALNYGLTGYDSLPPGIAKTWRAVSHCLRALRRKPCQPICWVSFLPIRAMNGA